MDKEEQQTQQAQAQVQKSVEPESVIQDFVKGLGFGSVEELKTMQAKAKELELAKMTEQQRLEAKLEELKPFAEKAKTLEGVVLKQIEVLKTSLPKDLLELAPDTTDTAKTLEWLLKAQQKQSALVSQKTPEPLTTKVVSTGVVPSVAAKPVHQMTLAEIKAENERIYQQTGTR